MTTTDPSESTVQVPRGARNIRIELLSAPGCPNVEPTRSLLTSCLTELGLGDVALIERVGSFRSPTVLVNGVDVMSSTAGPPVGDACRLDLPDRRRVLAAIRATSAGQHDR